MCAESKKAAWATNGKGISVPSQEQNIVYLKGTQKTFMPFSMFLFSSEEMYNMKERSIGICGTAGCICTGKENENCQAKFRRICMRIF